MSARQSVELVWMLHSAVFAPAAWEDDAQARQVCVRVCMCVHVHVCVS